MKACLYVTYRRLVRDLGYVFGVEVQLLICISGNEKRRFITMMGK